MLRSRGSLAPFARSLCTPVRVGVGEASRRRAAAGSAPAGGSDLLRLLSSQIHTQGPMPVKDFMTAALTHPAHGFYMREGAIIGRGGDFVTSPELTAVFGDLLGVWCVATWEQLGRPARVRLLEAGPGRGTLISDVLRSTAVFPGFHEALCVHLVEVSPQLRRTQRALLASHEAPAVAASSDAAVDQDLAPVSWSGGGAAAVPITWHGSLDEVPHDAGVAEIVLAHEFLDALPVHQIVATDRGWRERMVGLRQSREGGADGRGSVSDSGGRGCRGSGGSGGTAGQDTAAVVVGGGEVRYLEADERALDFVLSSAPTPASIMLGIKLDASSGASRIDKVTAGSPRYSVASAGQSPHAAAGTAVGAQVSLAVDGPVDVSSLKCAEFSPGAISFVQQLSRRLAACRGAALLIDYGADEIAGDTLRGILDNRFVHPLHAPGAADLSVDVDFSMLRGVARDEAAAQLRCPPLATQRDFLAAMGLEARVNAALRAAATPHHQEDVLGAARRLIAHPGMGTAYKVFALAHESLGPAGVVGFGDAPTLDAL